MKQIDAPVIGYEFPKDELLVYLSFDRLPKSWDPQRDTFPIHFDCYRSIKYKWNHIDNVEASYIAPIEKEAFLDFITYEKLAQRLSNIGKYDKSIEWMKRAQKHWEEQKDYANAASCSLFSAIQYRHKGNYNESLKNYANAEVLIFQLQHISPESKLTMWRIKAGRIMVEDYLMKGLCRSAYTKYRGLIKEINDYLRNSPKIDASARNKLNLYKLHGTRQKAEMLRILGKYNGAFNLYSRAYNQYSYVYAEEKAYSVLGQADCLRMLGKLKAAEKKYEEAETYAREKVNRRLLARVLRNKAELFRTTGQNIEYLLDELGKLANETDYLYGKIYRLLITGGTFLSSDPQKSIKLFEGIKPLVQKNGEYYKIEYAHSLFGLAEAKRLSKDIRSAWDYEKAYKLYKETGVLWGMLRTKIGISMAGGSNRDFQNTTDIPSSDDPIDVDFINRYKKNKLEPNEVLFLNIP